MSILPYGFKNAIMWKQPGPGRDWAGVEGTWSYVYSVSLNSDFTTKYIRMFIVL